MFMAFLGYRDSEFDYVNMERWKLASRKIIDIYVYIIQTIGMQTGWIRGRTMVNLDPILLYRYLDLNPNRYGTYMLFLDPISIQEGGREEERDLIKQKEQLISYLPSLLEKKYSCLISISNFLFNAIAPKQQKE